MPDIRDQDKGLLASIKSVISENNAGKAYVAGKYHEKMHAKISKIHDLLDEISNHYHNALDQDLGNDHFGHLQNMADHLKNVRQSLYSATPSLNAAHKISTDQADQI